MPLTPNNTTKNQATENIAMQLFSLLYFKRSPLPLTITAALMTFSGCAIQVSPEQALDDEIKEYRQIDTPTEQQTQTLKKQLEESESRSPWATASLANLYNNTEASQQDKTQVLPLYEQAFEEGYLSAESMAYVANQHLTGGLPNADKIKGYHYLRKAANLNNEWAQTQVANLFLDGNDDLQIPFIPKTSILYIPEDHVDFKAWYCLSTFNYRMDKTCVEKILLPNANAQNPYALLGAAIAYENGWHVAKDQAKAIGYYRQAAEIGVPNSKQYLGELLLAANEPNQQAEGVSLYEQLISSDSALASGLRTELATYYFQHKQYRKALALAQSAGANAEAYYQLYQQYANGLGVTRNRAKAEAYLQRAAVSGHPDAMFTHYSAAKLEKNERVRLIKMAAEMGSIEASVWMAKQAKSVADEDNYLFWLKESAIEGDIDSQIELAQYYQTHFSKLAYAGIWYQRAADQGSKQAKRWLAEHRYLSLKLTSGKLLKDGSFILPKDYRLIFDGSDQYLQANIEQVWPSHCGWVIQRASGEATVAVHQSKPWCEPSDQELELMYEHGVNKVVHNNGATAVLLNNGQVITWGGRQIGGYLIEEAQWHEDQAENWQELLAPYRAMQQGVVDIAALEGGFSALTKSGDIWQWGVNGKATHIEGQYRQLLGGYNNIDVCGLTTDDTLNCWTQHAPEKIKPVVKGVTSAYATPFSRGGYGFGIVGMRGGEFEGMLTSWSVYYSNIKHDRQIENNKEILKHNWHNLRQDKAGNILATNENGDVALLYYSGATRFGGFSYQPHLK